MSLGGVANVSVDSDKFRFGEDDGWFDCHYTVIFTCKVGGVKCRGEARAFLEYGGDTATWFHFEIFDPYGYQPIVEYYDDSYDAVIEKYYKELAEKYS